ncbi:hypothetical protein ACFXKJ_19375 [Kitasatospora indigofera]|uniref:hypothetical protein n=1 Tax=Kitasatospora indigofera TaxID=67307 RepID=UPI0036BD3C6C
MSSVTDPADDDARASALPHDVFHDFSDELIAGHEVMRPRMLRLLDSAMASDHVAGALMGRDVARLLLAVQNELMFDAATEYCEASETARAAGLWNRAIRLRVGPHEDMASAPYALPGLALLLDGDNQPESPAEGRSHRRHECCVQVLLKNTNERFEGARPISWQPFQEHIESAVGVLVEVLYPFIAQAMWSSRVNELSD